MGFNSGFKGLMFQWQTVDTDMTNSLQLTINLQKSHQTQRTLRPVCKGRTLLIRVDIHISSCGQRQPKCEPAICLVYPPLFCNLHSSSNPTNKNLQRYTWRFKQLYFSNHSELDNVHMNFSSHNDRDCCPQKYWYFPSNHPVQLISSCCSFLYFHISLQLPSTFLSTM